MYKYTTINTITLSFSLNSWQRPYHVEHTSSRPITEVKQHWARLVLGWETAWEHRVLLSFFSQLCTVGFNKKKKTSSTCKIAVIKFIKHKRYLSLNWYNFEFEFEKNKIEMEKKKFWQRWDSNPRHRSDWCLKPAP